MIDGKEIRTGTQVIAIQEYEKNSDSPVGEELVLNQWDTLVYLMGNEKNKHWWLVEDENGQVGYVPVAYIMIIIDETLHKEKIDTRGTRKEYGWNEYWRGERTGWRKKNATFSGSD